MKRVAISIAAIIVASASLVLAEEPASKPTEKAGSTSTATHTHHHHRRHHRFHPVHEASKIIHEATGAKPTRPKPDTN